MYARNPVESLAQAVYSALESKEILPDVKLVHRSADSMVRPSASDVFITHFQQMWGSTALGFGGMGGAAMTECYTTVIWLRDGSVAAVFFDGRHAYSVDNPNKIFFDDVYKFSVESIRGAKKYENSAPTGVASNYIGNKKDNNGAE